MPDGGTFQPIRTGREPVAPARWIKQSLFELLTGYSAKAQRHKMDDGDWPEWTEFKTKGIWKLAPDNHRLMNLDNYYAWVEGR